MWQWRGSPNDGSWWGTDNEEERSENVYDEDDEFSIEEVVSPQKNRGSGRTGSSGTQTGTGSQSSEDILSCNSEPMNINSNQHERKRKRSPSPKRGDAKRTQNSMKVDEDFDIEEIDDDDPNQSTSFNTSALANFQDSMCTMTVNTENGTAHPHRRPSFYETISYNLTNTRTLRKQLDNFMPAIHLDIVCFYCWQMQDGGPWQALVKDADNTFSIIESFACPQKNGAPLVTGRRYRFQGLIVLQHVILPLSSPIFQVLSSVGQNQIDYFRLCVTPETNWTELPSNIIAIPFEPFERLGFPSHFFQRLENLRFSFTRNLFVPD